ncbi:MAG: hypothetical protein AMJ38_00520 [Dehalococcoidia bacterium DG_22]|nr:MAG: hypothetical protein AMJ38_00520 [Dehalococcoidia bacterium DG_22]
MSIDNFKPQIWTAKLLENLEHDHVYANLGNRDYEGEIKGKGDSVRINSLGDITVSAYTPYSTSISYQELQDASQVLVIDKDYYFAFKIEDADKAQINIELMNKATQRASWSLAETCDDLIAAYLHANTATGNILTAVTVGTGAGDDDAYETLVDLDVKLSESDVPRNADRWVVVPPWYEGLLRKDPRFVSFGTDKNRSNLRGDPIGDASGFTVYLSNNVPVSGSAYYVQAGYPGAFSFAEQILNTEAIRLEGSFSDAIRGQHVYGYKVTRPQGLAYVLATAA